VSSNSGAIELLAPAKLNLRLEIVGTRPDGYHEIDSVFQAIDLADRLRIERAPAIALTVEGDAPADRTNLVWRAAEALRVGARIHLEKRIPSGAGLGGGSSDAAAALLGLVRLYRLGIAPQRLLETALSLGADVPFFLTGGRARCGGIGERVVPLPSPAPLRFLLLWPEIPLSTARVYRAYDEEMALTPGGKRATVAGGKQGTDLLPYFNRLQEAAERLDPRLRDVRSEAERTFGLPFTMTGSGSAYFAPLEAGMPRGRLERAGGVPVRTWIVNAVGATAAG
jgi:4-diphosphocytidyl-2-C-methyl-D-erythritol kinase